MMRQVLFVGVLVVACLMIAPGTLGGKPSGGSDNGKTSVISGDITSGPSTGSWMSGCIWNVDGHIGPTGSTVGGKMTIGSIPSSLDIDGTADGVLTWDNHGEYVIASDSNRDLIKIPRMNQGTYYYPDTSNNLIANLGIRFYHLYFPSEGKYIEYTLQINSAEFSSGQQLKIEVAKSTVTISGTDIPFDMVDFNKSSTNEAWMIYDDLWFDFKIVIDK